MKKEVIDQLLEVARQTAPEVESAVSGVKDKQLRGVIAGVIMQRILQEVGRDEGRTFTSPASSFADLKDAGKKAGTQARILNLQSDNFFRDPRRLEQVLEELRIRGFHHNQSDVRMSLLRLARKKSLRRIPLGEGRQRMYFTWILSVLFQKFATKFSRHSGNPGSQSGVARPGIQEFQDFWMPGFHRHDGKVAYIFSPNL